MADSLPEETVPLRDGSRVLIRPVRPDDKELFLRGWQRFGEESRYRRFMGAKGGLTRRDLAYFTEVDHVDHEALGARDAETGEGVGVARYIRLGEGSRVAEAAVAVVDDWQGRGLGGVLLRQLTARAREHGIERFHASLFAFNKGMLTLFGDLGDMTVRRGGASDELEIDVEFPCESGDCLQTALRAAAEGQVALRPEAAETGG